MSLKPPESQNSQHIDDHGLIQVSLRGDQTIQSAADSTSKVIQLAQELIKANRPVLVLVDLTSIGKETVQSRRGISEGLKKLNAARIAIISTDFKTRYAVNFVNFVAGKLNITRFFGNRQNAEAYLLDFQRRANKRPVI
jgi:hypothetical protein